MHQVGRGRREVAEEEEEEEEERTTRTAAPKSTHRASRPEHAYGRVCENTASRRSGHKDT
jgi:hypothetical protein